MFVHNSGNSLLDDVDCSFAGCTSSPLLRIRRKMELQKFNRPIIVPTEYTKACENRSKSVMQEHMV